MEYRPVETLGAITVAGNAVPRVSLAWRLRDYLGAVAVRLDIQRMNYAIQPGVYAVGNPRQDSPVLVSANYKLSFDVLRRELDGLNVWVLVIDTKGVNVWCAAGKGTFGTEEVIRSVMATGLAKIVTTRQLILPQLGAPGVSAHMVETSCGFTVKYGPVRARDIKKYLTGGKKADTAMRRVTFGVQERLEVSWLELAVAATKGALISLAVLFLKGFNAGGFFLVGLLWVAIFSGTVLTAILLPYIPGRAFSFKGGLLGLALGALLVHPFQLSLVMLVSAVSAFLALNYTGCSTFTSLSGVKKEIRFALPVITGLIVVSGLLLWRGI